MLLSSPTHVDIYPMNIPSVKLIALHSHVFHQPDQPTEHSAMSSVKY